jgi:hypothetical protein
LFVERLHEKYSNQVGEKRLLPYPTFIKYMKAYHIDVAIARAKEDCCDTCMRLSIAAADPNIGEEEKALIEESQRIHANDARTQRLALKEAIKIWGRTAVPIANFGEREIFDGAVDNLPEYVDEALGAPFVDDMTSSPRVRLQCEDFGGNLTLPHYGRNRPGRDYYISNLSIYNFIISDLTTGKNKVYLYDERAMGKGCDALCSLRWLYHFRLYKVSQAAGKLAETPNTLYIIMDNCVGQNKSQVKVNLMFDIKLGYNILK